MDIFRIRLQKPIYYVWRVEFILVSANWNISGRAGWHNSKTSESEFGGITALKTAHNFVYYPVRCLN